MLFRALRETAPQMKSAETSPPSQDDRLGMTLSSLELSRPLSHRRKGPVGLISHSRDRMRTTTHRRYEGSHSLALTIKPAGATGRVSVFANFVSSKCDSSITVHHIITTRQRSRNSSYSSTSTMKLHLQVLSLFVVLVAACFVQLVQGVSPQRQAALCAFAITDAVSYAIVIRSRLRVQPSSAQSPTRLRPPSTPQRNSSAVGSSTLAARSVVSAIVTVTWSSLHRMAGSIDSLRMPR